MKTKLTYYPETEEDLKHLSNAISNGVKLDNIYDEVFRKVLKYSESEKEVEAYTLVWDKLNEYLND